MISEGRKENRREERKMVEKKERIKEK